MPAHLEPGFVRTGTASVRLSTSPAAPWLARQLLGQWCREWLLPARVVGDAVLVASELVTEIVASGAGWATIGATVADAALEVSVTGPLPSRIGAQASGQDDLAVRRADVVDGLAAWIEVRLNDVGRTVVVAIPVRRAP